MTQGGGEKVDVSGQWAEMRGKGVRGRLGWESMRKKWNRVFNAQSCTVGTAALLRVAQSGRVRGGLSGVGSLTVSRPTSAPAPTLNSPSTLPPSLPTLSLPSRAEPSTALSLLSCL